MFSTTTFSLCASNNHECTNCIAKKLDLLLEKSRIFPKKEKLFMSFSRHYDCKSNISGF